MLAAVCLCDRFLCYFVLALTALPLPPISAPLLPLSTLLSHSPPPPPRYGDYHQKRHKLKQVLELVQQTSNPWAGDGSNGEEKSGGGKKKKKKKGGEVKGAFS